MNCGIYYNINFDSYVSIPALNCSSAKKMLKCDAALLVDQEKTQELNFGSAAHEYIGEGKLPAIMPKMDRRTKDGKAEYERFCAANRGKVIVTEDEFEVIKGMHGSVYGHPLAASLYAKGRSEVTVLFDHLGVRCKARFDWLTPNNHIVDLKTCASATTHGFRSAIISYGYSLQSCWYQTALKACGITPEGFSFVAVEKTAPYMTNVFTLGEDWLEMAQEQMDWLVERYANLRKDAPLAAYTSPEVITLAKPAYF